MKDQCANSNRLRVRTNKVPLVYVCTSVFIDYTLYLKKCLEYSGYYVEMIAFLNEQRYRSSLKSGWMSNLKLRFCMYVLYPLKLSINVLCSPSDSVFVVTSNTFYAPTIASICARFKNRKIVNLIYDLYPDALEVAGVIKHGSAISKILGVISRRNCKASNCSVYLGEFLRKHSENRWGRSGNTETIDISADLSLYLPNRIFDGGKIRIHYGGQIGYMHDADSLIESVLSVVKDDALKKMFEFSFRVSGAQAKHVEESFKGLQVLVSPPLPSEQWREEIRSYNIGLVTLSPGGATVCLPSKSYAMMAAGLPIIAICPLWSDLAQMLLSTNAGWVVSNSPYMSCDELSCKDYQARCMEKLPLEEVKNSFVTLLKHISENQLELLEKRSGALHAMKSVYGKSAISLRWKSILESI